MKDKLIKFFTVTGLIFIVRLIKIISGEERSANLSALAHNLGLPILALVMFTLVWGLFAGQIKTSLGTIPGPIAVYHEAKELYKEHKVERQKKRDFYTEQKENNKIILANNPASIVKIRSYSGKPTYIDQIFTSLKTVFAGFLIATLIALPIGIICGVSTSAMAAMNPIIQIFKPVSPLAWLPIVTMVVSAVYVTKDGLFEKSFINSAITVALCSLWPSLINTATGVKSIETDYINVGKVLKLGFFTRVFKIIIPSSLPLIFTGLRISLGVGWMVLIAAEMLAQNPGLGKFVWDEFQNGSSQSLARIIFAVITIGVIGALLDRLMTGLQKLVSFN